MLNTGARYRSRMLATVICVPLFVLVAGLSSWWMAPQDATQQTRPRNVAVTVLEQAQFGRPYTAQLRVPSALGNDVRYVLTDGLLPPGLRLHKNGAISGTVRASNWINNYEFSVRMVNKEQGALAQSPRYWFKISVVE